MFFQTDRRFAILNLSMKKFSCIDLLLQMAALLFITLSAAILAAGQPLELRVSVTDQNGALLPNAIVMAMGQDGKKQRCETNGSSLICLNSDITSIEASADGFAARKIDITEELLENGSVTISLEPEITRENVTVTADRTERNANESAASVTIINRHNIETAVAPVLDDVLRQVPGFSIFRRSSSRNANPTTQGVSFRGVGASGASRTLIIHDGVPINDPFGGWIQWNRVPMISLERVELVRGGGSSLYGSSSLSGTVNMIPRKFGSNGDSNRGFSAELFGGTQDTISASTFAGIGYRGWQADVTANSFQTGGYLTLEESAPGPVDSKAGVRSSNFSGRFSRSIGDFGEVFVRPSYFGEVRSNGTGMQTNRTHSKQMVAGGRFKLPRDSSFDWRIYGGDQVYDQIFSAVNTERTAENLTRVQRSPAQHFGYSGQLIVAAVDHTLVGGIEGREVRGSSDEIGFANQNITSYLGSGGREKSFGVYFQDIFTINKKLTVTGAIRYDRWNNYRALNTVRSAVTGVSNVSVYPDRSEDAISPSLSFLFKINEKLSIYGSASGNFRSPTLNELYRGFRVGNVQTNANENLLAERSKNFESGVGYLFGRLKLRAAAFYTEVDRSIGNVTISTSPSLIIRQRQNAGRTISKGFESDAEWYFRTFSLNTGYQFVIAKVADFDSNPSLVGKAIPQVARHQFTLQATYRLNSWTFSTQIKAASSQFDDDLNLFRLEPYFQTDFFVAKRLKEKLLVFAAVENIFNSRHSIGLTPLRTVSLPTSARIGIRWN